MTPAHARTGAIALALVAVVAAIPGASAGSRDSDGDGMPSTWERRHGLDPHDSRDASRDPDRDDLTNLLEYQQRGDPHNPDTDVDGLTDGDEVKQWHSSVDVPTQLVGRVQVSGRCPKRNHCELRDLFAVTVLVKNQHGKTVAQTRTLTNGRFAFERLRPKRYELEALSVVGASAPGPLEAPVPRNQAGPTVASFTFSDANRTGVVGQATQSPTCAGPQREGEDCIAPLSGATISVREGDAEGPVVASATTGVDGFYAFRLGPGDYTLVPERYGDSDLPSPPAPVSFTVFDGDDGPNLVDSEYDTGIR